MKTAFAYYENRIAPLFDTAEHLLLYPFEGGEMARGTTASMPRGGMRVKTERLQELGVSLLICGAVSRELQEELATAGIECIPFVGGELAEIVAAWREGRFTARTFMMPGCGRRRRGAGGGCGPGRRRGGGGRPGEGRGRFAL